MAYDSAPLEVGVGGILKLLHYKKDNSIAHLEICAHFELLFPYYFEFCTILKGGGGESKNPFVCESPYLKSIEI